MVQVSGGRERFSIVTLTNGDGAQHYYITPGSDVRINDRVGRRINGFHRVFVEVVSVHKNESYWKRQRDHIFPEPGDTGFIKVDYLPPEALRARAHGPAEPSPKLRITD